MEFEDLPESCIANILSFTTPRDACVLSLVSSTFKSAANSDVVWERFLPSDYRTIIPSSLSFPSKKHLFLYLSQNPILIDDGLKSFALEKLYGKKCYMLSARSLSISWGDTPRYWKWTSLPESRFSEVAELVNVCWFEINGRIKSSMLSPETLYTAYLVFQLSYVGSYGFNYQPFEVSIGIAGEGDTRNRIVYLVAPRTPRFGWPRNNFRAIESWLKAIADDNNPNLLGHEYPKWRGDGWREIELGDFFNKGKEEKEVEMSVYEVKSGVSKGGIFIQGIEIRPKLNPVNE